MNETKLKFHRETKEVHDHLLESAIISSEDNDEELTRFYLRMCDAALAIGFELSDK